MTPYPYIRIALNTGNIKSCNCYKRFKGIRVMDTYEIRKVQGLLGEQSFSVILPKIYATNIGIRKGDFVKVRQEGAKIIIEKASS
jgi:hypothetical protein